MKEKRKPLSKKSRKLLKQGCADAKNGRVSPIPSEVLEEPLTEKRVRELIAEELAKQQQQLFTLIPLPSAEPSPCPFVPPPQSFPPPVVAYACGFPAVTVLYMAQTYEPPQGWTSATITLTPPPKGQ